MTAVARVLAGLAVALLVAAIGTGSTLAGDSAALRDRATTDLADDVQGPQVHFMYVLPADGTDNQLDTNGVIEQSIVRIENWMLGQTGNQGLNVDTYHGVPDITFFRMPHTDAQATSQEPWPIWTMGADLVAAGFNKPGKVYAVFYDGHSTWSCGAAHSPALPMLGAMYLQAWPTGDPAPCHAWGTGTTQPGYFDMGILHEVLHAMNFSPQCAPHQSQDGYGDHVDDSPTDILYAPDAKSGHAPWDVFNAVLDYNHDDYYKAHIPGCPDLSDSPYLTPMISATVTTYGSGTVASNPTGLSCPQTCTAFLAPPATITATPGVGQVFTGWSGSCSGTGTCTLTATGTVIATFAAAPHLRSLSLRVHGHQLIGSLQTKDHSSTCLANVAVLVERRTATGWTVFRKLHTGRTGGFAISIPKGHGSYRASAPMVALKGEQCSGARSSNVTTG